MAASCNIYPSITNKNGDQVDSKLFQDLLSLTKSRELTKAVWAATQSPELMTRIDTDMLAKDENGELTIDSVRAVFGIDALLSDQTKADLKAKELGIVDKNGEPIKVDLSSVAIDKAIQFNESQEQAVADVARDQDGKYVIKYEAATAANSHKREELRFKKDLNNRLVDKLNRIGLDVGFMNDPLAQGVFDPLNAERNADGFITMIKIAHGEIGESALPEEFAHLIVRGLKDNTFRQRIAKVLTPEAVREYLGDRYEAYRNQYSKGNRNVEEYLQEEVMGQILAESLQGGNLEGIFWRFWNAAKEKFAGVKESEIRADIAAAKQAVEDLTKQIDETDNLLDIIDPESLKMSGELYSLSDEIRGLGEAAMDHVLDAGVYRLSHRFDIRKDRMTFKEKAAYNDTLESINAEITGAPKIGIKPTPLSACRRIASEMINQMIEVQESIESLLKKDENGLSELDKCNTRERIFELARIVNLFNDFEGEYIDWLETLSVIDKEVKMPKADRDHFHELAAKANQKYLEIHKEYRDIRFDLLSKLITIYVGTYNKTLDTFDHSSNQKGLAMTIDSMLRTIDKDSSLVDAFITSLGESTAPVLNMTHEIIYKQQAFRDRRIAEIVNNLKGYQEMLDKAGIANNFVFDRDENGDKTGYFLSPYDYKAFDEAKDAFIEELAHNDQLTDKEKKLALRGWREDNMIYVEAWGKTIRVPNPDIYGNKNFKKQLDSEEKRKYYDAIMRCKIMLDEKLPVPPDSPYLAPQMRGTIMDQFDGSNKITLKNVWQAVWSNYTADNDLTEYGEFIESITGDTDIKVQKSDMKGERRRKVPVFFTHKLKNMQQLNTDATQSMAAYTAMAINFEEMDKVNDIMFLLNQYVNSDQFQVGKKSGGDTVFNAHETSNQKYAEKAKKTDKSNIAKAHTNFLRANLWGEQKDDLGNVKLKTVGNLSGANDNTSILNLNMVDRFVSNWISKTQLGFNVFSGWSNVTQGEYQMMIEGIGGRFFTLKELGRAHKIFAKLEAEYLKEVGTSNPKNLLHHLMNTFNAKEDFFREVSTKSYQLGKLRRYLDSDKAMALQSSGEHMLHAIPMIATLLHTKVKIRQADGSYKTSSLFDALEVREYNDAVNHDIKSYSLVIKEGTVMQVKKDSMGKGMEELTDPDGNQLMYQDDGKNYIEIGDDHYNSENLALVNANATIAEVNRRMHGGYGQTEKGTGSHLVVMRYLMRFRQWMTSTYTHRFGTAYYDTVLQDEMEGFYRTYWNWIKEMWRSHENGLRRFKLDKDKMTATQIENISKARAEISTFVILGVLDLLTAGWKDKDSPWAARLAKFTIIRMFNEIGAMTPTPYMATSAFNLTRQPLPGSDILSNLLILMSPVSYFDTVESGKYAHWPKAARAIFEIMPYKNVWKFYEFLLGENYIFNAYKFS